MKAGEKVAGGFLVAGCDGPEMLDGIEEALDEIALGVKREVAVAFDLAVGFWRDDRGDGAYFQARDEAAGVITLVGEKGSGLDFGGQRFGLRDVVNLAAGEAERQGISQGIDDGMDFRRQSATRTADGLVRAPFFSAPALC